MTFSYMLDEVSFLKLVNQVSQAPVFDWVKNCFHKFRKANFQKLSYIAKPLSQHSPLVNAHLSTEFHVCMLIVPKESKHTDTLT